MTVNMDLEKKLSKQSNFVSYFLSYECHNFSQIYGKPCSHKVEEFKKDKENLNIDWKRPAEEENKADDLRNSVAREFTHSKMTVMSRFPTAEREQLPISNIQDIIPNMLFGGKMYKISVSACHCASDG